MCKFNRGRSTDIQPLNTLQSRCFRTVDQPENRA
jgi:hypothetical protein